MKSKIEKIDEQFSKELDEIAKIKFRNGTCDYLPSKRRTTKAIVKTSLWPKMKEVLIDAEFEDDRWK